MTSETAKPDRPTISIDGVQTPVDELPWWNRPRRLRRQLVGALLIITFLSVMLVGALNFFAGRRLLDEGTQDKLVGIGEARSQSVENGIDRILAQLSVAAADLAVVEAVEQLSTAFDQLGDSELTSSQLAELEAFYEQQVIAPIAAAGLGPVATEDVLPKSASARYLQYHYVVGDPYTPDTRSEVTDAGDGSAYSAVHAETHAVLSNTATALGFGDMLIVAGGSSEIVYSVDKRIDLGADLSDGPYADTAIADTVLSSLARVPIGSAVIADQGIYIPGGGRAVVFVAAHVRRDTEVIGSLVAEIPIEALNSVTTAGGDWEAVGLGEGESYVVGVDGRLRSESRLWIEDPDKYLDQTNDEDLRKLIQAFGSPVGLQPVDTEPAQAAFEGRTFEGNSRNYLGRRTFSYATSVDAPGVNWIVIAEVPLTDARGPLVDYAKRMGLVLLIVLPAAGLIGFTLADRITRPIPPVVDAAFAVAAGDRDPDLADLGRDEFGDLGRQLKRMARDLGAQEQALADEYEQTRQLLLAVLPPRIVKADGTLETTSTAADVATVVAVGIDVARTDLDFDERELARLLNHIHDSSEAVAAQAGMERIRAGADRYLFLAGVNETDDGADRALDFATELSATLRSLAVEEDAPLVSHIGISTGPVATGVLQRGSLTFGAWGEPVRRALAISALSRADEVLVDDSVKQSLTEDRWPLDSTREHIALDGEAMSLHVLKTGDE